MSPNFMHCLINHLALHDRYLHRASEKARMAIRNRSQNEPSSTLTLLAAVWMPHRGDIDFDRRSKTRTVQELLAQAMLQNIDPCLILLNRMIASPSESDAAQVASQRQVIASHIAAVLRNIPTESRGGEQSRACLRKSLNLLACYAYRDFSNRSDGNKGDMIAITPGSRSVFRSRLLSCLSHTITQHIEVSQIAANLIHDINECKKDFGSGRILGLADKATQRLNETALQTLSILGNAENAKESKQAISQSITLLICLILLQVYGGEPDSVALLEDIIQIFTIKNQQRKIELVTSDFAVLTEVLLDLMSKQSLILRRTACQVFGSITSFVDQRALQSLYKVGKS